MTNIEWLMQELSAGRPVSTPRAIRERGWWRLAAGVEELARQGWNIARIYGPNRVAVYVMHGTPVTYLARQLALPLVAL